MSVDLFKLKKESLRMQQERHLASSRTRQPYFQLPISKIFNQAESEMFS